MPLDVIGAGLPRTGTESLKNALEMLGFARCYHMVEMIQNPQHIPLWDAAGRGAAVDFEALFAGYRAAVDFPAMWHWRTLAARYPQARVVLTVRNAGDWHTSLTNTILSAIEVLPENDLETLHRRQLVKRDLVDGLFEGRATERDFMCALLERHRRDVVTHLDPERLLIFDVAEGWQPLCNFLGLAVPEHDFPRGNATAEFRRKYLGQES